MTFVNHCIKTYSQMQETVALPSVESECCGIAKAATMGLGTKGLMEDLGSGVGAQANADSRAVKNITSRRGTGRVRRTEVREVWIRMGLRRRAFDREAEERGERGRRSDEARGQAEDGVVRGSVWRSAAEWSTRA